MDKLNQQINRVRIFINTHGNSSDKLAMAEVDEGVKSLQRERDALREALKTANCPNNCFVKGGHYNNIGNINQCKFCREYRRLLAK